MSQRGSATQNDRVLAQLRKGPLDAVAFQPPNVCDGGKPIWRVAARVGVLKDRGFVILSERRRDGTAQYRLVGEPERALSEMKDPRSSEQADPGSVPSQEAVTASEGVRSAAPAESHPGLFDASVFAERGGYENSEAA